MSQMTKPSAMSPATQATQASKTQSLAPPTQQELCGLIDKGNGTLLSADDVATRKKAGDLPANFQLESGFGVYRLEIGGNEFLCITNILCDKCVRTNGKVKRCPEHKRKKRRTKRGKNGEVVDDASDREKVGALRHVDDDDEEEDKIDGAVTPDGVLTPGVGGAAILVNVDPAANDKAGPHAGKKLNHVKGILVRGPNGTPQFIPNDKLTKEMKLKFDNYVEGELVEIHGKMVFVPAGLGAAKMDGKNTDTVAKDAVADKVDKKVLEMVQKDMAVPVQAEIADNGLAVMKVCREKPKDKETPVGIVARINDEVVFVQVGGKDLNGGANAALLATTPADNAKTGDVVATIIVDEHGKAKAVKPSDVPKGAKVVGQVVLGKNKEMVFVANGKNANEAIEAQHKALNDQMVEKLEKNEIQAQAKVTGQAADHVSQQVQHIGADGPGGGGGAGGPNGSPYSYGAGGEIKSVGFGAQQYGGSQFARPQGAGAYGGASGQGGGGGGGTGPNGSPYSYGAGGEIKSVGFGAQQYGGSVFVKPMPTGSAGGGGGGAAGKGGGSKMYGAGGEIKSVAIGGPGGAGGKDARSSYLK